MREGLVLLVAMDVLVVGGRSAKGAFLVHPNHKLAPSAADQMPTHHHEDFGLLDQTDHARAIVGVDQVLVLYLLLHWHLHGQTELLALCF